MTSLGFDDSGLAKSAKSTVYREVACGTIQSFGSAFVLEMLYNICKSSIDSFFTSKGASIDHQILTDSRMSASLTILDDLLASSALKIDYIKLISQVSVHLAGIKPVSIARWAAEVLLEPFLNANMIEQLLTVSTLLILFLQYLKAYWANKGIYEFPVGLTDIVFCQLVVSSH